MRRRPRLRGGACGGAGGDACGASPVLRVAPEAGEDYGVVSDAAPECMNACPVSCGPPRTAEVELICGTGNAAALHEAADADERRSAFDCSRKYRDVYQAVTTKAADLGFPEPRSEAGSDARCGASPVLCAARVCVEGCGVVGSVAPDCMKTGPGTGGPLRDGENMLISGTGNAEALREAADTTVCKHRSAFVCGLKYTEDSHAVSTKTADLGFPAPRTEADFLVGCETSLVRAAREAGVGCDGVAGAAPECMQVCPEMCGPLREAVEQLVSGKGDLAALCRSATGGGLRHRLVCHAGTTQGADPGFPAPRTAVFVECMKACPMMCGPLRDDEVKLGGSDDAEAQREAAEAEVCKHRSACGCGLKHRDVCHTVTTKAAEPGFPTPRMGAGLDGRGGASPVPQTAWKDGDCGVAGHAAPDRMKACPVLCGPLRDGENMLVSGKGSAEALSKAAGTKVCKHMSAFECGLQYTDDSHAVSTKAAGPDFPAPRTEADFVVGCSASLVPRAAREGGVGCDGVAGAAPE